MARKHLLDGLLQPPSELPSGNPSEPHARPPSAPMRGGLGALGAVSRSIESLQALAIKELDPADIAESKIADRLSISDQSVEDLAAQIAAHGQQVPILVRPASGGRYEIVYGRRRLRACVLLGRKVRAEIKHLTDIEQVIAQGQENSARKDLTFIERAVFAANLEAAGHSREVIMAALAIDKTGLSKLISAAVKIPRDIIVAIGPAPKAGRDRWIELNGLLESEGGVVAARAAIACQEFSQLSSDERFQAVYVALKAKPQGEAARVCSLPNGQPLVKVRGSGRQLSLAFDKRTPEDFSDFLVAQLPELYAAFQRRRDA